MGHETFALLKYVFIGVFSLLLARITKPKWIGYFNFLGAWLTFLVASLLVAPKGTAAGGNFVYLLAYCAGTAGGTCVVGFIIGYIFIKIVVAIMRRSKKDDLQEDAAAPEAPQQPEDNQK